MYITPATKFSGTYYIANLTFGGPNTELRAFDVGYSTDGNGNVTRVSGRVSVFDGDDTFKDNWRAGLQVFGLKYT